MTIDEAIEYNKNLREYMRITDKNSEYKFLKENYEALDMAIKSLEQQEPSEIIHGSTYGGVSWGGTYTPKKQQPCEDCISRQMAIDVVRKWFDKIQLNDDICLDGIRSLPSVTPKARWIPVSERLPEHKGDYLVTFKLLFTYPVEVCYFDGQAWDKGQYDAVLSWMPLPESYRGDKDGNINNKE